MKRPRLILGGVGAAVLGGVSGLHLYWAAGGRRGPTCGRPDIGGRGADSTLEGGDGCRRRGVGDGQRAVRRCDGTMGAVLGVSRWGDRCGGGACRPGDRRPPLRRFPEAVPRLSVRPARHVPLLAVVRRSRRRRRSRLGLSRQGLLVELDEDEVSEHEPVCWPATDASIDGKRRVQWDFGVVGYDAAGRGRVTSGLTTSALDSGCLCSCRRTALQRPDGALNPRRRQPPSSARTCARRRRGTLAARRRRWR